MTVSDICQKIQAKFLCGDGAKEFRGVYVGDLLSRAMSHIECDNLWVTIMSNVNVIAVAALTEPAAVILAEDEALDADELQKAEENGITVLTSSLSAYEICARVYKAVSENEV